MMKFKTTQWMDIYIYGVGEHKDMYTLQNCAKKPFCFIDFTCD